MKITSAPGEIRFRVKRDTDLEIGAYGRPALPIPSPGGPKRLCSVEQGDSVDPIHPVHAALNLRREDARKSRVGHIHSFNGRLPRAPLCARRAGLAAESTT